jgi:alpha-L-rhamnosidase
LDGWSEPGYEDRDWRPVRVSNGLGGRRLVARPAPPIRVTEEVAAKSVSEPRPGVFVFDLGQNLVGWARLVVEGPSGTRIKLRFAEMLWPDGTVYTQNLRSAQATDVYYLEGGGKEIWEPTFTFHGFRYVQVTGYPGKPDLDAITGVVVHSDTPRTGSLSTSSALVNKLVSNIVWGQRGNFLSVPTDCPQRDERLGWMGDAQIFARTACYNMDVYAFFVKWMRDVRDAQSKEGSFPDFAPVLGDGFRQGAPAWSDAGVIVPWVMYRCYGDEWILEENFEAMRRFVDYVHAANPDLIRANEVGNDYGDWVSVGSKTPKDVLATAYFANSARIVARAASVLGKPEIARKYADLFESIKRAYNEAFVAEDGRVKGETQTSYVLSLRFDLLPAEKRPAAVEHLLADLRKNDTHLTTGFLGVRELLPALTEGGHSDVAYRLLLDETYPSWGYSIKHGATTIWERWDGWTEHKGFQTPGMNSFNHYSFGSVGEWLFSVVGGIDTAPDAPGYKHVLIRPIPGGGLTRAHAEVESPYGPIVSDWKIEGGVFRLKVELPVNTTATIRLPGHDPSEQRTVGSGRHQFEAPFPNEGRRGQNDRSRASVDPPSSLESRGLPPWGVKG